MSRTNGFVTADTFAEKTSSRRIHHREPLGRFPVEGLGKEKMFINLSPID